MCSVPAIGPALPVADVSAARTAPALPTRVANTARWIPSRFLDLALRETAGNQRTGFYLNHAGGVVFAVGGLLVLGLGYDTWEGGLKSAAVSIPIGLVLTYTQPRGSWKAVRSGRFAPPSTAASLRLAPVHAPGFTGLALGGAF